MHSNVINDASDEMAATGAWHGWRYSFNAGFACSVVLHGLALAVFILVLHGAARPNDVSLVIPVNIVELADRTAGPLRPDTAVVPQEKAGPPSSPAAKPAAVSPLQKVPPPDDLEIKLRKLAQLRQPILDTHLARTGEGLARKSAMREEAALGAHATIEDFLRAQIEHHWTPDLAKLHGKNISVLIRLAINGTGAVTRVEVVNGPAAGIDQAYDEVAVSARNAALLASPLTLPPGHNGKSMDVILNLDTRDALR
jgi:hypothetical protein